MASPIVAAAGLLALVCAIAFGLAPARHVSRQRPPATKARQTLVAIQVAASCLLLVLAGLLVALAAQGRLQERRHLEAVQAEIAKFERRASRVAAAETETGKLRERIRLLDSFRQRTASDLDAIKDVTALLAPPAWLSSLELRRDSLSLAGEIEQAAPLLKSLDSSPRFSGSEFTVPILRTAKVEAFRIRASREEVAP